MASPRLRWKWADAQDACDVPLPDSAVVDLHIIDSGRHPENFAAQLRRAQHPLVTVHVAQPVWGNTLEARRLAYATGTAPFQTWVDDDDEILSLDWVAEAVTILRSDPQVSAVFPRWRSPQVGEPTEKNWASLRPGAALPQAHWLTLMRRGNVAAFFERMAGRTMVVHQDLLLVHFQARFGRLVALPDMAYRWDCSPTGTAASGDTPDANNLTTMIWQETLDLAAQRARTPPESDTPGTLFITEADLLRGCKPMVWPRWT